MEKGPPLFFSKTNIYKGRTTRKTGGIRLQAISIVRMENEVGDLTSHPARRSLPSSPVPGPNSAEGAVLPRPMDTTEH